MSVGLAVEIEGGERLERLLDEAAKRAADLRPAWGAVDKIVTQMETQQFAGEGVWGAGKWAPLKPKTLAAKARKHFGNSGILRMHNTLWASLVKAGAPQGVRAMLPLDYVRGTQVPYAAVHQMGVPSRGLPRRQVIPDPLPRHVVGTIETLIAKHLEGARAA